MTHPHHSAAVIAVGNQKGGTGKSTMTVHLAAALGRLGRSCLVIDLDPAAGATKHLGISPEMFAGTMELLTSDEPIEILVVSKGLPTGVSLIPARPQLSELDHALPQHADRTQLLTRGLAGARRSYDYILLDTSPYAAFATTIAAYAAADWFLLTAFPHPLSLGGLTEAFRDLADVRSLSNPGLQVLGVVLTNVDRRARRMLGAVEEALQESAPGSLFRTQISQAIAIPDASGRGQTVFEFSGSGGIRAAEEFTKLAAEVEARIEHHKNNQLSRIISLTRTAS